MVAACRYCHNAFPTGRRPRTVVHEFDDERVEIDSLDEVTLDRLREATVVLPVEAAQPPTEWG